MAQWNINGWYPRSDSNIVKKELLQSIETDIIGLCETHLRNEEGLSDLVNYYWTGQNRTQMSANAVKGSGGVGFLIKKSILSLFNVEVLDSSFEGIHWIKLN